MDPREQRQYEELRRRFLTGGGTGVAVPVDASATEQAVTFTIAEPDVNYGVVCTPSWDTTVYVLPAEKLTDGLTIRFGTAAGATDTVDYVIFRQ
jgi:hypothetical protein